MPQLAPTASAPSSVIRRAACSGCDARHGAILLLAGVEGEGDNHGQSSLTARPPGQRWPPTISLMVSSSSASAPPSASAAACSSKTSNTCSGLDFASGQHLACWTHRGEDESRAAGSLARDGSARPIDFEGLLLETGAAQRQAIPAEGVGENDAAARFHVSPRHLRHDLGMEQIPAIRIFAQGQAATLQLGAPCAIGQDRACCQQFRQLHGRPPVSAPAPPRPRHFRCSRRPRSGRRNAASPARRPP